MPSYAFGIGTFALPQIIGYPLNYSGFRSPTGQQNDSFEYSDGWPGTIQNINYPETYTGFSSPIASENESFENAEGWPGT